MDERGLTAFILTVHSPALSAAAALALVVSGVAVVVLRGRSLTSRALIGVLWFVGVLVVTYAAICRAIDVPGFDVEAVSVLP